MPSKRPTGWLARYRDANGEEQSRMFDKKTEARDWEREQKASVKRGTHVAPRAGKILVRDYAEQWRRAQLHHRPETARKVESVFRLHVVPFVGQRPIAAVTRSEIQGLVNRWASEVQKRTGKPTAPVTVHGWYAYLSALFRAAQDDGVIGKTPCTRINLPEVVSKRVYPLTRAQVELLVDSLPADIRPVAIVGAGLGVRVSEALGITLDRVRFLRREVLIDRQQSPGPPYDLIPLKNSRTTPARVLPAPVFVLDALSAVTPSEDGRMFTRRGRPLRKREVNAAVAAAVASTNLPAGTTFHGLRHFYASLLIEKGESVAVVAARLGDTKEEVLKTYSHLFPDSADRTRLILDAAFDEDHEDRTGT